MDPLSVAASVAGVAVMGAQLSQTIYNLISSFCEAEQEMSNIANCISHLAMVLNELEGVLRRDSRVYQKRMLRVVMDILKSCQGVFQSISKYVSVSPQHSTSSKQVRRKVCWCFQQHRVRPLQAGLESMKSTLNVLLHVVHLARVTEAAESFVLNAGRIYTRADVREERRILVGVVLDNRRSILSLKEIEEDRDRRQNLRNIVEDKQKLGETDSDVAWGHDDDDPYIESEPDLSKTKANGASNVFGGWGGSSAKPSVNASLFAKAAKEPAKDSGKKEEQKPKIETTGFDADCSGKFDEKQGHRTKHTIAKGEDYWGPLTISTKKGHKKEAKGSFDGPSNVIKDQIFTDISVGNMEAAADVFWRDFDLASVKDNESKNGRGLRGQKLNGMDNNNGMSRESLPDPHVPAELISRSERYAEVYEISKAGSNDLRKKSFNHHTVPGHAKGTNELLNASEGQENSRSQPRASEYYSMSPEMPVPNNEPRHSEEAFGMKPSRSQITESEKGLTGKSINSQMSTPGSPPGREMVTPSAQWFLSVVPHESNDSALTVSPHSVEANQSGAQAEETVKRLLLDWTNLDPDATFVEETSGDWKREGKYNSLFYGPAPDERASYQPCPLPYTPQAYPMYAPQQWYSPPVFNPSPHQPLMFNLPPSSPLSSNAPPLLNERQTDSAELARLKKLILDEKSEQDARIWVAAAAASPICSVASLTTEEVLEDRWQRDITYAEEVDPVQMPKDNSIPWKAEPPRLQPVIMRDWLDRKFIFPFDMCQTWKGLDHLIQEAFGHLLSYKPVVEKGCYSISHATGEVILPSTWKLFVQPGLEIYMEVYANSSISGGKANHAGQESLKPPHVREGSNAGCPLALRSSSDDEASSDDVDDKATIDSFPDGLMEAERSSSQYMSIENMLLEQKKAKVDVAMKFERNNRLFQLKQQLLDQGAAIQARHNAANHAEQDAKLAWLEKQVRDQKEELDRLPSLLMIPPSSIAGDSLSRSTSSPRRKLSFGARLLARMPSSSIRSRGSLESRRLLTEG